MLKSLKSITFLIIISVVILFIVVFSLVPLLFFPTRSVTKKGDIVRKASIENKNDEPADTEIKIVPEAKPALKPIDYDLMIQSKLKYYDYKKPFIDTINFKFEDKPVYFYYPVYVYLNRYYLPVENFVNKINGSVKVNKQYLYLNLKNHSAEIDTQKGLMTANNRTVQVRNPVKKFNGVSYISLIDFTDLFDMTTSWDYDSKTISLYFDRCNLKRNAVSTGRTALIRLEDVSVDQVFDTADALAKLRIVGDYLYSDGVPFHVAWVPRYLYPLYKLDNDPSKYYSMYNADFLYTLDYLIKKGALIGLHGYTHQRGNVESIVGLEFNDKFNDTDTVIANRLKAAIKCANILNIPVYFFETPHYAASYGQHKVMEKYFNYLYEPLDSGHEENVYKVTLGKRVVRYVPTLFDYVKGERDTDNMIYKIDTVNPKALASFFYHPNIDFPYIRFTKVEGTDYPYYAYLSNSPLHRIIDTFYKNKFMFKKITSLK